MENAYDYLFKIILIGDSGVGKTCLLQRYTDNVYNESFQSTIGVDFKIKTIKLNGKKVKLQIWDTAGQERFKSIVSNYYRGANGVFLVFDMLKKESFNNISLWLKEFRNKNPEYETEIFLLGNKVDEVNRICISSDEIKIFCQNNNINFNNFLEVSAKTDFKVENAFLQLTENMIKKFGNKMISRMHKNKLNITQTQGRCC
ncbi:GTPase SAR1-like protein [Enterocytozoon bieneusi H348]|nr:GTPase SAR1-like protein [Enterocytozoon bieneusi H348]|eukprot:XP_001827826.1 GTPase SAR1-like protein [Enterocytozoon bieneusi H348]